MPTDSTMLIAPFKHRSCCGASVLNDIKRFGLFFLLFLCHYLFHYSSGRPVFASYRCRAAFQLPNINNKYTNTPTHSLPKRTIISHFSPGIETYLSGRKYHQSHIYTLWTKECEEKEIRIVRVVGISLISIQSVVATEFASHKRTKTNDANFCDVWI